MATFVNNLRLTEITTGDESGTWGTTTNANWDFVTDAFGYGVKNMASDADVTYTMADGSVDTLRSMYLKITSGVSLSATRTITIAPNTVSKVWIIENATTGGQSITISQGSGATVTITNGTKTMVYSDGAGAGAAVVLSNPTVSLSSGVTGTLPIANGGTGATTLTANNVILGNGTSAPLFVAPGSSGNVLTSNGTTWASAILPAGGLTYVVKTANYTTQDKEGVLADTSGGAFTVTLPAAPATGAQVVVADSGASWGTNNLTVGRNGSTIGGLAQDLVCDITGASVQLVYDGSTWEVYAQIGGNGGTAVTLDGVQTLTNKTISGASNTINNVPLSTAVTGTLPVANGGTGAATLTANNVLLGNGTSALQAVAPGSSGNVLTSNGTTWQSTTANSGAYVYISTTTVSSAVAQVDITSGFSSTYDDYVIIVAGVTPAANDDFKIRFFKNSSIVTSATYVVQAVRGTTTTAAASGGSAESRIDFGGTLTTDSKSSAVINLINANSTDAVIIGVVNNINVPNGPRIDTVTASNTAAGTFSGIRFYFNGGQNITSGTFKLYGIKKS